MQEADDQITEAVPPMSSGKDGVFTANQRAAQTAIYEASCDVEDAICALDLLIDGVATLGNYVDPAKRASDLARAGKALRGHLDGVFQRLLVAEAGAA